MDINTIANSWPIWLCACISVGIVFAQSLLYTYLGKKHAPMVGLSSADCNKAFRSGALAAIGPSIATVIVIMSMITVIGAPVSWIRLSMIGSAATELSAAQISAGALGVTLGGEGYGLVEMATAWFTMAINGCGWLLVVVLFTHNIGKLRDKVGGGDPVWLSIITTTACVGLMCDMVGGYLIKFSPKTISALVGGAAMFGLVKLSHKVKWLKEFALGFALIIGLVAGYLFM